MFTISPGMASLIEASIPLMIGIYGFLLGYEILPFPINDPVKKNYLRTKKKLLRISSITAIFIGLGKTIYVLYANLI